MLPWEPPPCRPPAPPAAACGSAEHVWPLSRGAVMLSFVVVVAGWPGLLVLPFPFQNCGCPSIRVKAVSRTKLSCRCFWHRFFAREVEDQDSGNLTPITCGGGSAPKTSKRRSFHQPSIRPRHQP